MTQRVRPLWGPDDASPVAELEAAVRTARRKPSADLADPIAAKLRAWHRAERPVLVRRHRRLRRSRWSRSGSGAPERLAVALNRLRVAWRMLAARLSSDNRLDCDSEM